MSYKKKLQIECLERYAEYTSDLEDIMAFLLSEELISKENIKDVQRSANLSKTMEEILSNLQSTSKIQLLEYEWLLLPVERIKITIVTDKSSKEFTFNH